MKQNPLKILLVDDNKANLRILGAMFEDVHFFVQSASSVDEAQEKLSASYDEVNLVLSDIQMPGLTGFDLVRWMKAQPGSIKDIPILLITSQLPETENRIFGLSLGAVDYLPRSLDQQELVLRVVHAIESFNKIKSLRQTLETSESLTATGRLFAASNHEIKNVAQIIRMATGIVGRELDNEQSGISDTGKQAIRVLQQSSLLLMEVTQMIGGLVGNTNVPIGPVDLENLVEQLVSMIRSTLKGEVELAYESEGSAWVSGSPTLIKQILINLLLNARDAILEGKPQSRGKIAVSISYSSDDRCELRVRDNGIGFPSQDTRTDFQPFASTRQLRGGTGLGLWLSAQLAQKMEGFLTLSSEGPGKGAVAKLTLKKAKR